MSLTNDNEYVNDRQLCSVERSLELLNHYTGDSFGVVIVRIKAKEEQLHEEVLRQALDLVQRRHPRLNSHIVGPLNKLRFETERTQKIPLRVVNSPTQNQQWHKIAIEELNSKIDISQNLMRAVLIYSTDEDKISYLITAIHHAIVDGLSATRLQQDILTYCQKIIAGTQFTQLPRLPALPSIEELMPKSRKGINGMVKRIAFWGRLTIKALLNRVETLGFEKIVTVDLRRCGMIHKELDTELTQQFIKVCKRKQLSIQPVLCAAMLFTTARKIIQNKNLFGKNAKICVNSNSAVDLRRKLNPVISKEHLGVFAGDMTSFHTLKANTSFWELAQDVKQQLRYGTKKGDAFNTTFTNEKVFKSLLANPNDTSLTVMVTNIGKVNVPRIYGPFEIEAISMAVSVSILGGLFSAAVTIFADKMQINFLFSEPATSYETAELLANNVISCITEICQREDIYFLEPPE